MNKKITAVTLTALMVLTMFTALVPSASAAKEVAAPYEFLGVTDKYATDANGTIPYFNLSATSAVNPSLLFFDLDDKFGAESILIRTGLGESNLTIGKGNMTYETSDWPDKDTPTDIYIAWLGAKHYVVNNGSTFRLAEKLVDEDEDDDHLLRVGESLSLPEGWGITPLEIDVDGGETWISLTKDGEEIDSEVVTENNTFVYKEDLDAPGGKTVVMNFMVETVFAGMNTNLVKINDIDLISNDVLEVKDGDDDLYSDYTVSCVDGTITIKNDDDVSLTEDDITDVFGGRIAVRVNEDSTVAAIVRTITEPGTYELMGVVNTTYTSNFFALEATSSVNPSLLYYDLDDDIGKEALNIYSGNGSESNLTIGEGNLTYSTSDWPDKDTPTDIYIAWLGAKHYVVNNGSTFRLAEKLVDEDEDDDHLLRVGESLSLPEGWGITPLEIDVDGGETWISLTKDGEEIDSEVVTENNTFVYKEDLDAPGGKTVVMNFMVETVFAGMNTNLVKINDIDLISNDVLEVKDGDDDLYSDYTVSCVDGTITIKNDDDISLTEDDITDILGGRFGIKLNEDGDVAAIVQEVIVGGGAAATPTEDLTVEPTVEPTEAATGAATGAPTAAGTAAAIDETPTPEPTKEPGFEAVFAVAGLLAVAYLVLRQRE